MTPEMITKHFYAKIPLSREMGVEVKEVSDKHAKMFVPLKPNINHVQTVFGGSLYAASALSCYALFQSLSAALGGLSDELVIQEGHIKYLAPVKGDFEVLSELKDDSQLHLFAEGLRRRGKARLNLKASVLYQGNVCAEFEGIYVYKAPASF